MKICVLSVIYPQALAFFDDFLGSLAAQTDRDFELLLVNDGVPELEKRVGQTGLRAKTLSAAGTPARLRKEGLRWALESGFDSVIFADADDTFDKTRVGVTKAALRECDMVCNELILFGEKVKDRRPMLGPRLKEGARIAEKDLLDRNCLGLSNTAVTSERLAGVFAEVPNEAIAYDWALFSRILHRGGHALFTAKTATNYRRHGSNLAALPPLSDTDIMRGVHVKAGHYASLETLGAEYGSRALDFKALENKLKTDADFGKRYFAAVTAAAPPGAWWWEAIKKEGELGL